MTNNSCQKYREQIAGLLIGDVPTSESEAVEQHLLACPDCRAYQHGLLEDDRLLTEFVESVDDNVTQLEDVIMQAIDTTTTGDGNTHSRDIGWSWARLLGSKTLKFAAAAVVIVGILAAASLFDRFGGSNAVWADMMRQVEEAQDFICRVTHTSSADPRGDLEMVQYRSQAHGFRTDIYRGGKLRAATYIKPTSSFLYTIVHRDRTYALIEMTEEQLEQTREESNARSLVEYFKSMEFEEIGRRKIDGSMASGIEVTDPPEYQGVMDETIIRLWVDVETNWPVRIEVEATAKGGEVRVKRVMEDFQWNATLTSKDFEFEIPEDYKLIGRMEATRNDEESAIEGLRGYAEFTAGKYPSVLTYGTAIYEAEDDIERHKRNGRMSQDDFGNMNNIQNACAFYVELVNKEMDPAYYGEDVDTRDFDRVLMRWRLEDGRYRVVYGDLRFEDVSPERLADLEDR